MSNEVAILKEKVMDKYPLLYYNRRRPSRTHCMSYGLSVGFGWIQLIDEMSSKIEPILEKMLELNPTVDFPKAVQVKEKFGTLRFYVSGNDPVINNIIREYEEKSFITCEDCGNIGTIRRKGWHRVLCDLCFNNSNKV